MSTALSPPRNENTQSQLWGLHAGVAFVVFFCIGFVFVTGWVPPLSPSMSLEETSAYFTEHATRIRVGMLICMYACIFQMPFTAVVCAQIARIEGDGPRVWTYTSIMAAAGNIVSFTFPFFFWNTAAFRPERSAEIVQMLNDLAWLPFTGMAVPFIALPPCVAIVSFLDKSEHPVFPRWFGWYTIATTVVIFPAALVPFFTSGWFAWNNVFGWWVPFADFFGWYSLLIILLYRGVLQQGKAAKEAQS